MKQISAAELDAWLQDRERAKPLLLDVREPWEYQTARIAGSQLVSMRTVPARLHELDRAADTVVICHHGSRSQQVAMFLERQGFGSVYNLAGGVDAWARSVDPDMPKY